jgi:DNA-binding GntR family transcriptional regulator
VNTRYSKILIDKDSVTKRVLNELRKEIITRSYAPGARLLETKLAEKYDVSRGTIRSVAQELSNEGLVEFLATGGCVVVGIDEKVIRDTYSFRCLLEQQAGSILIASPSIRYTPMVEVLDLYTQREKEEAYQKNPLEYCADLDIQFHQALVACAENRPIYRAWCALSPVIRTLLTLNITEDYWDEYVEKFYDHHKIMIDYMILRDQRLLDEIQEQLLSGVEKAVRQLASLQA